MYDFSPLDELKHANDALRAEMARREAVEAELRAAKAELELLLTRTVQRAEELEAADHRKDEFIATLAHELRNPLAPVRDAAEILARIPDKNASVDRVSGVIRRQVTHMARLLDDLLDVARIARGKLPLHAVECDLGQIALTTAEDYRDSIVAADIWLTSQPSAEPLPVLGDPVRLAQAIGNYLQNATRFARGTQVTVESRADPETGEAVVLVRDEGVGISPELLPRLFQSFAQAEQDLANPAGGLGLGLALTRGLAQLHGGRVLAHSEGEGRGATFELRIPLQKVRQVQPHSAPDVAAEPARSRILVIEDNRDSAETLSMILESEGHEVRIAYDGASGVKEAAAWVPDAVISDLGLPGALDGYSVARTIRSCAQTARIRLLALSGYADRETVERSRAAGFDAHLAKPVEFRELLALLVQR